MYENNFETNNWKQLFLCKVFRLAILIWAWMAVCHWAKRLDPDFHKIQISNTVLKLRPEQTQAKFFGLEFVADLTDLWFVLSESVGKLRLITGYC